MIYLVSLPKTNRVMDGQILAHLNGNLEDKNFVSFQRWTTSTIHLSIGSGKLYKKSEYAAFTIAQDSHFRSGRYDV
jgi:hypothetical protein